MKEYLSPSESDGIGLAEPPPVMEEVRVPEVEQRRADRRVQTVCLLILTLIASGVALYLLRPVLVPFVLALFFAFCLTPLLDWQTRRLGWSQPVAVAGTAILALVLLGLLGLPLIASAGNMSQTFTRQYQPRLNDWVNRMSHKLPLERLGLIDRNAAASSDSEQPNQFKLPDQAANWFAALPLQVTGLVSGSVLVVIFTIFILMGRTANRPTAQAVLGEIEGQVQRYVSRMVFLSAVTGLFVTAVLALLGVEFAPVFGFLAFLLNFIPTIGGIIATLLPLPVILLQSPDLPVSVKIAAVAIPGALQFVLGNFVQPRVFGNALELHPVVVLLALIFWGMIWGLAGAFLATPMTAVLRIVLERIPATKPLAELLKGNLSAVI